MKKKIAFVIFCMNIGGQERALLEMFKHIDLDNNDVSLFLYERGGEFEAKVPKKVHMKTISRVKLSSFFSYPGLTIKRYFFGNIRKIVGKIIHKDLRNFKYQSNMYLPIKENFDYVYLYDSFCLKLIPYVLTKFKCAKKIFWLHGEVNDYINMNIKNLARFDKIFAVSKVVANQLVSYSSELKDKIEVFYNYMDINSVKEKSQEGESFSDEFQGKRILTVGRINWEKGQDLAVFACKRLIEDGYNIRWYICGKGTNMENINQLVIKNDLQNDFILLGAKENPYPFIRDCDLYVQPSIKESWGLSVQEALILERPSIVTSASGLKEVVEYGKNGYIVDVSAEAIYQKVKWCLDNPKEVDAMRERIKNIQFKQEDINKIFI